MAIVGQRVLRASNFYPGPANDGIFGAQTAAAVTAYQNSASGPSPSGVVDSATWRHMQDFKIQLFRSGIQPRYNVRGSSNPSLLVDGYNFDFWYTIGACGGTIYYQMWVDGPAC